jgi:hypothetical protein
MSVFRSIGIFLLPSLAAAQLSLTIATEQPTITSDEDFVVTATVSNPTGEDSFVDFGDRDSDYAIDLRDFAGAKVPESAYSRRLKHRVFAGSTRMVPFPSKATRSVQIDIEKFFDVPGPGVYTVQLSITDLRSNLLVVTVIPGSPAVAVRSSATPVSGAAVIGSSGAAKSNFSLKIDVDRSAVYVGKGIPVYAALRSAINVTIPSFSSGDSRLGIDVRGESRQPVAESERGRLRRASEARDLEIAPRISLSPRGPLTGQVDIAEYVDMSAPGNYSVQLYWTVPADLGGGEIRSNMLQITILPRGSK